MKALTFFLLTSFLCLLSACAGHPIVSGEIDTSPTPPTEAPKLPPHISAAPAEAPRLPPAAPKLPTAPADTTWIMKAGKLRASDQPAPKLISKTKDPKTGQTITSTCFKFSDFAIEEVRVTGEIGAAEINLRRANSPGRQALCSPDFKGTIKNLPAIEGFFAGATADYVVVEGADPAEAIPNFQLISLKTMKQAYKNRHEPGQDVVLAKSGGKTSLTFFAPMTVKCELAVEGSSCWKDVLLQNSVKTPSPMPDCKTAFNKAKAALEESPLVTMRAQIRDIESPKLEFLGGPAVCRPEK